MTEAPRTIEQPAYHESDETYVARMTNLLGANATIPPQPDMKAKVRDHLISLAASRGLTANPGALREISRTPVVTDDSSTGYHAAGPGETPTGDLVVWSIEAHERVADDAEEPVLRPVNRPDEIVYVIPPMLALTGGGVRVQHDFEEAPIVRGGRVGSSDAVDLMIVVLDSTTLHVEFPGRTDYLLVSAAE